MLKLVLFFSLVVVVFGDVSHLQDQILRNENTVNPDGSFSYAYETGNGIAAQASGQPVGPEPDAGHAVQGSYEFVAQDGSRHQVQYVADENGYRPRVS